MCRTVLGKGIGVHRDFGMHVSSEHGGGLSADRPIAQGRAFRADRDDPDVPEHLLLTLRCARSTACVILADGSTGGCRSCVSTRRCVHVDLGPMASTGIVKSRPYESHCIRKVPFEGAPQVTEAVGEDGGALVRRPLRDGPPRGLRSRKRDEGDLRRAVPVVLKRDDRRAFHPSATRRGRGARDGSSRAPATRPSRPLAIGARTSGSGCFLEGFPAVLEPVGRTRRVGLRHLRHRLALQSLATGFLRASRYSFISLSETVRIPDFRSTTVRRSFGWRSPSTG